MKKLLLVLILCTFFPTNIVYSQTNEQINKHIQYNTYLSKGRYAMKNENYSQAIAYFDSASLVFPHFHKPYFEVVVCTSRLNDYEKAYLYAVKMILTGSPFCITPETLGEFCNTDYYKQLKVQEDSLYQYSMQKRDTAFANAVIQLFHKNQLIGLRKDTTTFYEFVALCVQKNAFPSYLNVGTDAYRYAFALLYNSFWHSNYPDSDDWKNLLSLIHRDFLLGGIEASLIAQLEDTYYRNNNLPLRYGTFSNIYNPNNDIYPSIEELNKNRIEAGLEPFELEAILWNIDLNILTDEQRKQ